MSVKLFKKSNLYFKTQYFPQKHTFSTLNDPLKFKKNLTNRYSYKNFKFNFSLTNFFLNKNNINSNASRSSYTLLSSLPIHNFKLKNLFYRKISHRSRTKVGILCRTKGKYTLKQKQPTFNKHLRYLPLILLSGFFMIPSVKKNLSFVISSSGQMSYILSTYSHQIFKVYKHKKLTNTLSFSKKYHYLSNLINIPQIIYLISQLPKFKFISSLEIYPGKGSQYVTSPGSKSLLMKTELKTNLSLLKLPSGVRKVFSIHSNGLLGQIPFSQKKLRSYPKAGYYKKLGKKPLSRGVAKNPVDHPHGGRNKAIRYQRTPWGFTTKYK